jgi:membrane-bound lytic murein transglycosylase B
MHSRRPGPAFAALSALALLLAVRQPPAAAAESATSEVNESGQVASELETRFQALIQELVAEAPRHGLSATTIATLTAGLSPDAEVLGLLAAQPEHLASTGDYIARLASESRIRAGRERLAADADLLARIEQAYGVDRHVLVAIWGIESNFGASTGTRPVLRSLATLAVGDTRRPRFWRGELISALRILEAGHTSAAALTGSWAGAMGHTQFIPSTCQRFAVDFDGDGRRDIWGTPADALASAANYLKASGWPQQGAWGVEARLPAGFDHALARPGERRPLSEWKRLGIETFHGMPSAPSMPDVPLALLLPAGHRGPAFLVGAGFGAILLYNNSVSYALAVGHLADRLAGGGPFAQAWPAGDRPLPLAEREELQRLLTARGLDTGGIDGLIGARTRGAIRSFQLEQGLPADAHPDAALLERLRNLAKQ